MEALTDFIRRMGAPRMIGVLTVLTVGVAGLWGLIKWGNAPQWVPVVQNVSFEVAGAARDALDEEDINNELSASGTTVLVEAKDVARARVELAERGIERGEIEGFELFDEVSWGMTDFSQRVNYRRALEGELERTIGDMRGIARADVHIALPDANSFFARGQEVEASVLLHMGSGARPAAEQVEAVTFLVASSVDGLNSENVTVIDDSGRVLSAASEPNSAGRIDRRRIEMQLELEDYLETRAAELVEPLLGAANVRVRVSAELDFEQVERRTEAVDPNQQVLTTEERSEVEPGDPSQGAAQVIQNNSFDVTRSTEVATKAPGAVKRLTVAVALNEALPRAADPALLTRIEDLVGNAVGLDPTRGDDISVLAMPFEPVIATLNDATPAGPNALDLLREFQRPLVLILGLVLMFVLALRGLSVAKTVLPEAAPRLASAPQAEQVSGGVPTVGVLGEGGPDGDGAANDPSRMVRAWLGEG